MRNFLFRSTLACGLLFAAAPAFAQFACQRADLQKAADGYVQAQNEGNQFKIPLTQWVQYTENLDTSASLGGGVISQPIKLDYSRSLLDTATCSTFTEAVALNPAHPYVFGTFLSSRGGDVGAIDVIVTDAGDWLFDAASTLKYAQAEKWPVIPEADRDTRATILAAANAYLDSFNDKSIKAPFGSPCARLEGGAYTAKGAPGVVSPTDTCDVGVPSNVKITDRRYVVDETIGAVAVQSLFGNNKLPDIHTFRVEQGKIRYVHTITVCKTPNCGFPASAQPPKG